MFAIGIIKGTIIGMGIGVMAGLALKEVCKMKKTNKTPYFLSKV